MEKKKKRNMQDATLINNRALKKRVALLELRMDLLESGFRFLLALPEKKRGKKK